MKKLLSYGGAGLMTAAFLDPMIASGLGREIPWIRDVVMFGCGVGAIYLLVRFRKQL
jgi:hypothetical protein